MQMMKIGRCMYLEVVGSLWECEMTILGQHNVHDSSLKSRKGRWASSSHDGTEQTGRFMCRR